MASKAATWVKEISVPPHIVLIESALAVGGRLGNYSLRAEVTPRGCLGFTLVDGATHSQQFTLKPEQVLALARWILETFEDTTQ